MTNNYILINIVFRLFIFTSIIFSSFIFNDSSILNKRKIQVAQSIDLITSPCLFSISSEAEHTDF